MKGGLMELGRIINRIGKYKMELAIFLVIPLIAVILSSLPADTRNGLKVNLLEFNVPTFYTAIFVHEGFFTHFLPNISWYYLLTFTSYFLSRISRRTKWYNINFLIFLLIFPMISYSSLILVNRLFLGGKLPPSCGMSGIVSAILGLTPISFLAFIRESGIRIRNEPLFAMLPFLTSALLIPYIYQSLYLLLLLFPTVVVIVWYNRGNIVTVCRFLKKLSTQRFSHYLLAALSISLYFGGVVTIFPREIVVRGSSIIDIFTHYLGWITGFFLSYLLLLVGKKAET